MEAELGLRIEPTIPVSEDRLNAIFQALTGGGDKHFLTLSF